MGGTAAANRDLRRPRRSDQPARAEFSESVGEYYPRRRTAQYNNTHHLANHSYCRGNSYINANSDISYFDGSLTVEDYLEWEQEVEEFFAYTNIPQSKQVKFVVRKLIGRANAWWNYTIQTRYREGRSDVMTWSKMKCLLRKQFLPWEYDRYRQRHQWQEKSSFYKVRSKCKKQNGECGEALKVFDGLTDLDMKTESATYNTHIRGMRSIQKFELDKQQKKLEFNYIDNFSVGSVDRFEKTKLPLEQLFHMSSMFGSSGALGMHLTNDSYPSQTDYVSARNKCMKLPYLLEKSLSLLQESQNIYSDGSNKGALQYAKMKQLTSKSLSEDDSFPGRSKENKLPHWLREAASAPRPALPPSISIISHFVCVIYEPPHMPCTVPPAPPLIASLPSLPGKEIGFILPSLNLNLNLPSSYGAQGLQSCATPSHCPAVFKLVAFCMDHAPYMASMSDIPNTIYHNNQCPASKNLEYCHLFGKGFLGDFKYIHLKQKTTLSTHLGGHGNYENYWVQYRMDFKYIPSETVWKESSLCTKTWNNLVLQLMKVSDMLEFDAGFLLRDTMVFIGEFTLCTKVLSSILLRCIMLGSASNFALRARIATSRQNWVFDPGGYISLIMARQNNQDF